MTSELSSGILQNPRDLIRPTPMQLDEVLNAARCLSNNSSVHNLAVVTNFLKLLPAYSIWPTSSFFVEFLGYLAKSSNTSDVARCMPDVVMNAFQNLRDEFLMPLSQVALLCSDCDSLKTLALLIQAAAAAACCINSSSRVCEKLFASLMDTIVLVADVTLEPTPQRLCILLFYLKPLVITTCGQGSTMIHSSIVNAVCKIIALVSSKLADWDLPLTFLYNLAITVLSTTHLTSLHHGTLPDQIVQLNLISMLADLAVRLNKPQVVDVILPFLCHCLEKCCSSWILQLRLLDAVSSIASLGFPDSYRDIVLLMKWNYLSELDFVGSAMNQINNDTEIETLASGFLQIAHQLRLTDNELSLNYLDCLLSLCSEVGWETELENYCSRAKFLGALLPAVAEICYGLDPNSSAIVTRRKLFRNLWYYIALYGLAPQKSLLKHQTTKELNSTSENAPFQAVDGPHMWERSCALLVIAQGTPALVVSAEEWRQDEEEINAMDRSPQETDNKKVVNQRVALSAALGGRVKVSAIEKISDVKATLLLAVALLEIMRCSSNGVILFPTSARADMSAFSFVIGYLKTPNLEAVVFQCLTAIAHHAFEAAFSWLENQTTDTETDEETLEAALSTHTCCLIKNVFQREELICDTTVKLFAQLRDKFPQVMHKLGVEDLKIFERHTSRVSLLDDLLSYES